MKKVLFLVVSISCFLLSIAASEEPTSQKAEIAGFRELKWGMSLEDAKKIYPDLIPDKNFTSGNVYNRQNEERSIASVEFDSIKYFFKDNSFYKVLAEIETPFLPVERKDLKIITAFSIVRENIEAKYGHRREFTEEESNNGAFEKKQEALWLTDAARIKLSFIKGLSPYYRANPRDKKNVLYLSIENVSKSSKNLGF